MFSLKMSEKKIVFMLGIILYSVNQAASFKCYVCSSTTAGDCYKNPSNAPQFNCSLSGYMNSDSSPLNLTSNTLKIALANTPVVRGNGVSELATSSSYQCGKAVVSDLANRDGVVRACIWKPASDEQIKSELEAAGLTVKSLHRCNDELCNSSNTLGIGLLSVMSSVLLLIYNFF